MKINGIRIIATYTCSRNCKFCYQSKKQSVFLKRSMLEKILNTINYIPEYVTIMGGEVSEFPDKTNEIIMPLIHRFNNVSVTTNGMGDLVWYESLFNLGITNISFSIPSITCKHVIDKMLKLKKYGHVRANCFFNRSDPSQVKDVLTLCRNNSISLTLCEDILRQEIHKSDLVSCLGIDDNIVSILDNEQHAIIKLNDGYEFYVFRHVNNYNNDNLIILPNGNTTYDFNDVLKGVGNV